MRFWKAFTHHCKCLHRWNVIITYILLVSFTKIVVRRSSSTCNTCPTKYHICELNVSKMKDNSLAVARENEKSRKHKTYWNSLRIISFVISEHRLVTKSAKGFSNKAAFIIDCWTIFDSVPQLMHTWRSLWHQIITTLTSSAKRPFDIDQAISACVS